MRIFAVILMAFVLAVVAIWLWLGGPGPASIEYPSEPVTAEPREPPVERPSPVQAEGTQVLVELTARARILPPEPPFPCTVRRGAAVLPLRAECVAGAGTTPSGEALPGQSLLRIALASDWFVFRAVRAAAGSACGLELGTDVIVHGSVRDDGGAPVSGARVWCGVERAGELVESVTDDDGRFEATVPAGSGVPVVVRAPDRAHAFRLATVDAQAPAEQSFTLLPAAELTVRCAAAGQGIEQARVLVQPGPSPGTEAQQFPWFLQAVEGLHAVDASGSCTIANLPRGAALAVTVQHPLVPGIAPVAVTLHKPREVLTVPLPFASSLSGHVLGPDGKPLAGARVSSRPGPGEARAPAAERWLLPADALAPGATLARTDAAGRFQVARPAGAAALLSVRPPERDGALAGLEMRVTGGSELDRPLLLPVWTAGQPALAVLPPGPGPWQVRVKPQQAAFVDVAGGQAFRLELPKPALYDVTVRVAEGGGFGPFQDKGRLAVMDLVEIATAR